MSTSSTADDPSKFHGLIFQDEFRPPEPEDLFHRTKLAHGTLYSEPHPSSYRFSYVLQPKYDDNEDGNKPVLVLTAEQDKKSGSPFIIKNAVTKTDVGSVVLQFKTMKYVSYSIFRGDLQVASVVYHVPTIRNFLNLDPPRMAQMVLPNPDENNPTWLAALCQESIVRTGSLKAAFDQCPGLFLFRNAVPYKKRDGTYGLNFHGRGKEKSSRNMQLLDVNREVVCQVVKWDAGVYNVDFAYPCSSFLAFAFALAQLDL